MDDFDDPMMGDIDQFSIRNESDDRKLWKPPLITRVVLLLTVSAYLLQKVGAIDEAGVLLCAGPVFSLGQGYRLVVSVLFHRRFLAFFSNFLSFFYLGSRLEPVMGSLYFGALTVASSLLTNSLAVSLDYSLFRLDGDVEYLLNCSLGLSGLVFALFTLHNPVLAVKSENPQMLFGKAWCSTELLLYPWVFLSLYQFLESNVFVLHVAGILVGYVYVMLLLSATDWSRSCIEAVEDSENTVVSTMVQLGGYCRVPSADALALDPLQQSASSLLPTLPSIETLKSKFGGGKQKVSGSYDTLQLSLSDDRSLLDDDHGGMDDMGMDGVEQMEGMDFHDQSDY
mmetsp:Transcript_43406/g.84987  ORF Transcript_43406/g.84987 Transcript_43406/m.84987 type:complete len:340 (-) Transcript_43406:56-1075(-)